MPVQSPPCQWPTALDERGPPDDPSILLTATVRICGTPLEIVAIRVDPTLRWMPNYKQDIAKSSYQANGLDAVLETILEEIEFVAWTCGELLGENRLSTLELPLGRYRVMVIPAAFAT